jgi:hypothetical protein
MRIQYTCEDGSQTLAKWPSMALLHWLGRSHPPRPIENPEPLQFYVVGPPVPSDDHAMFLTLVYAEIERRWNKTPPFAIEPPNRNQAGERRRMPDLLFGQVVHSLEPICGDGEGV